MKNATKKTQMGKRTFMPLILVGLLSAASFGQTGDKAPQVKDVRIEGLNQITSGYVHSVIRTSAGTPLQASVLEEDLARLLATGRFSAADYQIKEQSDGTVVTFVLKERPQITDVRFVGNAKYSSGRLRKLVPLRIGEPLDSFRVREGADAIVQLYRDAGYGQATVTYDEQLLRATGELLYSIEEGPLIQIEHILFEGNEGISKRELKKKVSAKTRFWFFRDGKFDEDSVSSDAANLQAYYRSEGYLDARVGYRLDFTEDQRELTITFTIVEGTRYVIESLSFEGNTVLTDEDLRPLTNLEPGKPILQRNLDKSVDAVREKYGELGYIYAMVNGSRVFSETPGVVRITIGIQEGETYTVGRIVVRGNERTQDKVVRRALNLYPDDVLNMTELKQAEETLQQTQLFSLASVSPVGNQGKVRDILINVQEGRKAGDFLFGFGVTSNSGLVGSIVLDIKNFDIFDTPRSFSEFVKLKSFHGAGQRMRIEAQPGTEVNRFRIDFTEPYLMDKPLRFDVSAYLFERGRESYDERRAGSSVSFGKRLKKGFFKDWYTELAFRIESVNVRDLELLAARDIKDAEGSNMQTSIKASLVRDRTDNRFVPTRGDRIQFSYEQYGVMGGDVFGKLIGSYTWHKTLRTDELERKSVLSLKGVMGAIVGDSPVYERFYAGGIGSCRGFEFRGISPRQGLLDDPVGGKYMFMLSGEYSFPLYAKLLRGVVFADTGTVESDLEITQWRAAIGAGMRMQVEFFGPVPLEFAVAVPVMKDTDDEDEIFSFYIGATF